VPVIEGETFIAAPPELAFRLACDHERYREYGVRDLISARTVEPEDENGTLLTEWVWNLRGARIRYLERERHDAANLRIRYEQTQGDLKKLAGEWRFLPAEGGTRFVSRVEFDLGIPMLSGLLDPVAKLVLRGTIDALVQAIKREAERQRAAGGPPGA
jgi:coenzyme Q-binding protein COQ10